MAKVKHYGVFQFKDDVDDVQIATCFAEMVGMVGKIPGLLEMIHGPYKSGEGLNDGFTHGFIMT
ncbi:MAG: Dabb family protein, partial [Verrucomicrobiales bacterium]|nr:Dabb family protein [Verrucomicrobiales bacterium]